MQIFNKTGSNSTALPNGYLSRVNNLIKEHLQGIRVGIKNWLGQVSRYNIIEKISCHGTVILLKERGGKPIFYLSVGKLIRLATKTVKVNGFVTRNEAWKGPVERRGTNLINGDKLSCHGELN